MNFEGLDHIGIAVKDLEKSNALFTTLLGVKPYKSEAVDSENVTTSFFDANNMKVELLQATADDSAIAKFIEKRGEGLHHIAFEVNNIRERMIQLEADGFRLLNKEPKIGADQKLICFVHPKDTNGVLIELCQTMKKDEEKNDE